jgi:hypothetical protein
MKRTPADSGAEKTALGARKGNRELHTEPEGDARPGLALTRESEAAVLFAVPYRADISTIPVHIGGRNYIGQ